MAHVIIRLVVGVALFGACRALAWLFAEAPTGQRPTSKPTPGV